MNRYCYFFLFFLSRCLDLFTTYLVTPDLLMETSPFVRIFNFGWFGFILLNLIFVLIVALLLYKYDSNRIEYLENQHRHQIVKMKDYFRWIIVTYNSQESKVPMTQLLTKGKLKISSFMYFAIPSFVITMIGAGCLASINNLYLYIFDDLQSLIAPNLLFLFIFNMFIVSFWIMLRKRFNQLYK